jgi:hypothetical protein
MLTPRELGAFFYVLFLQVLCRMKKLVGGVKRAFLSGPSGRGSSSHSNDSSLQDSLRSSSFMPSPHGTMESSRYLAHDDIPKAMNNDDISIHTTEEMKKYESLHHREFPHTRIYDVNLLETIGLVEELPTILWTIGWGKLYDEPRHGSHHLTLEFLTTFEIVEKGRKLFVKFHLFRKSFGYNLSHFSELLDFSKSCLHESTAMRDFNKVEFSDTISEKSGWPATYLGRPATPWLPDKRAAKGSLVLRLKSSQA